MVFGNMGDDSGTGVAFTRDPSTGERMFYGEFLVNAQGEDVVAGIRTPLRIDAHGETAARMRTRELMQTQLALETHFRDMQDLEFTVERGKLYLLQTRTGKRTAAAALRIARDMVDEGLISRHGSGAARAGASARSAAASGDRCGRRAPVICRVCRQSRARRAASPSSTPTPPSSARGRGDNVILVRDETTPEDFHGIVAARAVLTARGGMTSHAAVVAAAWASAPSSACSA